jgi:hypothetical protein
MKLDLLTNATVVKDAIGFVAEHNNNNIKNEKVDKANSELLHNTSANSDAVTTTNNPRERCFLELLLRQVYPNHG